MANTNGYGPGPGPGHGKDGPRDRGRGRGRARGLARGSGTGRRGRADFSSAGPNQDRSITTVVVENIPEEKFDEAAVREFFSSFGSIQAIQMQAYKRLALIKYEDWQSAKQAYESPKVIFDNRFVKVYWYKPETSDSAEATTPAKTPEEIEREMAEIRGRQEELQKAHDEKMKKIKATEDSKKELERRREELIKSQVEETKKLKERLAAKGRSSVEPEKKSSAQTEALKAQLAALEAKASSMGIEYALSEDSFSSRGRGRGRATPYRGRAGYMGGGRGRGGLGYEASTARGGYRGGGRGGAGSRGGAYKLDNRTKRVAVSGQAFDTARDEALRQHLLNVGEYADITPNPIREDGLIVSFKDRFTAEKVRDEQERERKQLIKGAF